MAPLEGPDPEIEDVQVEPKQDGSKKDLAPSALCIPAGRCVQKHIKKIDELITRFKNLPHANLSALQEGPVS